MKCIIAGSRSIDDYEIVEKIIKKSLYNITQIISGRAIGIDLLGEEYAKKYKIPLDLHPVTKEDWAKYGKKAGYLRNKVMGDLADCAIIIWDGISPGSIHMRDIMIKLKKPFEFYELCYADKWLLKQGTSNSIDILF